MPLVDSSKYVCVMFAIAASADSNIFWCTTSRARIATEVDARYARGAHAFHRATEHHARGVAMDLRPRVAAEMAQLGVMIGLD